MTTTTHDLPEGHKWEEQGSVGCCYQWECVNCHATFTSDNDPQDGSYEDSYEPSAEHDECEEAE